MAGVLEFQHHDAAGARALRDVVEDVYCRSYVEAIASGHSFDSPAAFMRRFDAYTSPDRAAGFELVLVYADGQPVGQTWGWPLVAGTAWWAGLQLDDDDPASFTAEDGKRTFALSEIMVSADHAGKGIAGRLQDELLGGRPERRATLLVEPDNDRAYRCYLRWGWHRVGSLTPGWPDAPTFDVLMRNLNAAVFRPQPRHE